MDSQDAFEMLLDKFQQQAEEHGILRQQKASLEGEVKSLGREIQRLVAAAQVNDPAELSKSLEIARQQAKDNAEDNAKLLVENARLAQENEAMRNVVKAMKPKVDVEAIGPQENETMIRFMNSGIFVSREVADLILGRANLPPKEISPDAAAAPVGGQ